MTIFPWLVLKIEEGRKIEDISSDKHFSVIVAGISVEGFEPGIASVIVTPDGDEHKVAIVKTDLYNAAFEMFVHKSKWA